MMDHIANARVSPKPWLIINDPVYEFLNKNEKKRRLKVFMMKDDVSLFLTEIPRDDILYCPVMLSHFSPAPLETDRVVRVQ